MLMREVKLTDFGAASPSAPLSKEDERSAALAARAQKGDYDDGLYPVPVAVPMKFSLTIIRTYTGTARTKSSLSYG